MEEIETAYGKVKLDRLIHVYEMYTRQEVKQAERKRQYLQTKEGKESNRSRAKVYYAKHKDDILAKRKASYHYVKKKDSSSSEDTTSSELK